MLAASAGVVALLRASEPLFQALKLAGAAYLVYLGAGVAVGCRRAAPARATAAQLASPLLPGRAFRQGLLSNLGNPKIAVFFASLLPQFVPDGSGAFAAIARPRPALRHDGALVAGDVRHRRRPKLGDVLSGHVRRVLDAITGAVLVALGMRLATEDR